MHLNGGEVPSNDFDTSRPFSSFVETARKVILNPAEFFRSIETTTASKAPVIFAVACGVVSWPLSLIAEPFDPTIPDDASTMQGLSFLPSGNLGTTIAFVALGLVMLPLFALLSLYVGAVVQHLFVMIFIRQRRGFEATFRMLAYGSALSLLGWIPIVGYLAIFYGVYVFTVGFRELHSTSTTRALLAALVPILIWLPFFVLSFFL
ncbi:MAG: YIP1 family protein [Rubrobacteraceae bacterium]